MQEPIDATTTTMTQPDMDSGAPKNEGNKRLHTSDSSDSDKDVGAHAIENQLVLISTTPTQDGWRKVEKKKGRKG